MKSFHPFCLLAALLCAAALSSCSAPAEGNVPVNKKEIMDRFVAGTLDPAYAPAAFFAHFGGNSKVGEAAVQAHLQFYLQTNQDILKVQFEQAAPRIDTLDRVATDWMPEDFYRPTLEIISRLQEIAGKDVYILPTIYNPFQVARQSLGEKRIVAAAKDQPEALKGVLDSYKNALLWLVRECKAAGIEGFYTTTQGGEKKFYDIPGGFFETFIKPYDLELMGECNRGTKLNILHICDWEGPFDDLTRFADYPGQIVNTPNSLDGTTPFTLADGYALFKRPVLGGFDRKKEINTVGDAEVATMAQKIFDEGPKGKVMLGADCTVSSAPLPNIHAAVATAHRHKVD
ncbi:MAG: hypothetical protein K5910_05340 [Bacteroidales bacterium]|nr:hypothetical protein [Bacteroidales bacterium]